LHRCTYTKYFFFCYWYHATGGHSGARFSFAISHHNTHWQLEPLAHKFVHCPMCYFCDQILDYHQFNYHYH
jgi:hypothetical protein